MEKKKLIFGRNPVLEYLRALESGDDAELYVYREAHGKIIQSILDAASRLGIRTERPPKGFFSSLGPSSVHQGVALRLFRSVRRESVEAFIEKTAEENGVAILLDQLTDPHNIGSIIRSAEALGAHCVIMTKAHSPGITPVVVKSSAGATAYMKIFEVSNAAQVMETAKKAGFTVVGSAADGEREAEDIKKLRPVLLVVGSEGSGMRRIIAERCDCHVRINLKGKVTSLNASVAAGILLYELMK